MVPHSKFLVHWDDKTATSLDGGDHEKQIAVLVSEVMSDEHRNTLARKDTLARSVTFERSFNLARSIFFS